MPTKVSLSAPSRSAHIMLHVKPEWSQEKITAICTFFHLYLMLSIKGDDRRNRSLLCSYLPDRSVSPGRTKERLTGLNVPVKMLAVRCDQRFS